MGTPNTIFIEPADQKVLVREALAIAAFTAGHLIEKVAAGFQLHSTAAANAQKIFALQNLADAGGIDRPYVAGETARGGYAQRGDLVYGFIGVVAAVAVGDALMSAGNGTLIAAAAAVSTTNSNHIVGYAAEAIDNSGGSGEVRIQVEVA